ncbi:N-acetyltransferase [Segetibacter sp. 3557_3]|uniref:GNAT family N-acetyltransferase n=1 Tax=Segetibacter sp. 3557_3 TaxID=2547429 RepID=UPI00105912C9|nr:GNAT family N-acetyltransferase [Segetibacter sp. 3557_3]TDH19746.1 N-acetyltransferase [Segetibacter sp. 3557_3]
MSDEVTIRKWRKEDAAALAVVANNKKIWLNVRDRFPYPYSITNAVEWIAFALKYSPAQNLAITYKGHVAGSVGVLVKEDVYRKSIEIGYFIGEAYWGKGVATKAVQLLLEYISVHFQVIRIYAEVFEHNRASMRVLEKNGFTLESIRKKSVVKNQVLMDDYVWVKLV